MATSLVTQIDSKEFITKLKKIIFSTSDNSVTVTIAVDGVQILNEIYYPDTDGNVTLYEVNALLSTYLLPTLTALVTIGWTTGDSTSSQTFRAFYTTADITDTTADFLAEHFLTHLHSKETNANWREVLYFYPSMPTRPRFVGYYDDNTVVTQDYPSESPVDQILSLDVSPAQFAQTGKKLVSFTITAGSRRMDYNVSHEQVEAAPKLLFRNSFGCEETIYCIGTHELEPEYQLTSAYVEGDYRNIDVEEKKVFKAFTGPLSADMANWADDLFRSTAVYLFTIAQDQSIARGREVVITTAKSVRNNEVEFTPDYYFEYRYAQRNHNVFDKVVVGRIFDHTFANVFN